MYQCKAYYFIYPSIARYYRDHIAAKVLADKHCKRLLLLNPIAMAFAPPEDCQLTTSTLSTALSDLSAPSGLQRASAYSLDVNVDALSEFDVDAYVGINWKRLLGYHYHILLQLPVLATPRNTDTRGKKAANK